MEFDKKTFLPPFMIFALFSLSITSLAFSGLSADKAMSIQNDVAAIFLTSVQSSDIVSAMAKSAVFVMQNAVLPILPFLILSAIGFSAVLWLKPGTKELAMALAGTTVFALAVIVLSGQSLALMAVLLGYFALLLPVEFEERKTALRTGYAFSSYMLRYMNIALAAGVFIAILLMPNFDKAAEQQMISSVNMLLPDAGQLKQAQNEVATSFINQASTNVKELVDANYAALPSDKQAECSQFKDSIDSGLDSYKSQLLGQLQAGNASIGTEQVAQEVFSKVGIFSAMAKSLPLLVALSLLFLLELLKPALALAGGAVYSVAAKKYEK